MNSVTVSSGLTSPRRPRLEVAFTRRGAVSRENTAARLATMFDASDRLLAAVSAAASNAAAHAAVEPAREPALEADFLDALDRDLADWNTASSAFKRVLAACLVDVMLDPLTWRIAERDVGVRPNVSVYLLRSDATAEEARDVDVTLIYRGGASEAGADLERLAEAMTPDVAIPSPAVVLQARRNAAARTELLTEFGALTASQVAELSGSEAKNRSALAGRWRREGRLVAVEHHGTVYYPAFQFDDDGKPRPVVERILEHLDDPNMTSWQQALWFTTANGWLDGRRPVDLLESDPEAVLAAAREALREPVG